MAARVIFKWFGLAGRRLKYNKHMKQVILLFATIFGVAGAYVPMLFGDNNLLSGWSILGGLVGGIFGIWLGALIAKRIG